MSHRGIMLAHKKSITTTYKHLNPREKRLIKIDERLDQLDKYINYCYGIQPRKESGAVDWNEWEKDHNADPYFQAEKEREKLHKSREALITKYDLNVRDIYAFHMGMQFHYSQSF